MSYLFSQKGTILARGSEEEIMLTALDAGAEDVRDNGDGTFEVITAPSDLETVRQALEQEGVQIDNADITHLPAATVPVAEEEARKVLRLIDVPTTSTTSRRSTPTTTSTTP